MEDGVTSNPADVAALSAQRIELPSWAFGNCGTRFKVVAQMGVPRTPEEKIADAAEVQRYTDVHAPDTNSEFIVAALRRAERIGGQAAAWGA